MTSGGPSEGLRGGTLYFAATPNELRLLSVAEPINEAIVVARLRCEIMPNPNSIRRCLLCLTLKDLPILRRFSQSNALAESDGFSVSWPFASGMEDSVGAAAEKLAKTSAASSLHPTSPRYCCN